MMSKEKLIPIGIIVAAIAFLVYYFRSQSGTPAATDETGPSTIAGVPENVQAAVYPNAGVSPAAAADISIGGSPLYLTYNETSPYEYGAGHGVGESGGCSCGDSCGGGASSLIPGLKVPQDLLDAAQAQLSGFSTKAAG